MKRLPLFLLLPFCLALTACTTASVFEPYPKQIAPVQQDTEAQQYQAAEAILTSKLKSNDWQLYALELGRVQQLAGQYQQSIATFTPIINAVEKELMAPKIQGSVLLAASGSMLTNDNALPYQLKGYEIILLYQYQALNYLAVNDLQDALVAFRRANELQDYLESLHQKEIAEAEAEAVQKNINPDLMSQQAVLQSTYAAAAGIKSSFQNGLTYFLASFAFASEGDLNDAVVAMQKALQTAPQNSFVQTELLQLLQARGGGQTQINQYLKLFAMKQVPAMPANNTGQIVVLLEEGFIAPMQQVSFSFPVPGLSTSQYFVFPTYKDNPPAPGTWQVSLDKQAVANLQPILTLQPLAAKALAEDYPMIFTRQALRILLQAGIVAAAESSTDNNNNDNNNNSQGASELIGLVATTYSYLMANADLRSWLLLPSDVQVGVYQVPAGDHILVFNARQNQSVSVKIQPNQTVLVWVNAQGGAITSQVSSL